MDLDHTGTHPVAAGTTAEYTSPHERAFADLIAAHARAS
jgi:hypothetical protein